MNNHFLPHKMPKKQVVRNPSWTSRWDGDSDTALQIQKDLLDPEIEFFPDKYSAANLYKTRSLYKGYCSPPKFRNNIRGIAEKLKEAGYTRKSILNKDIDDDDNNGFDDADYDSEDSEENMENFSGMFFNLLYPTFLIEIV